MEQVPNLSPYGAAFGHPLSLDRIRTAQSGLCLHKRIDSFFKIRILAAIRTQCLQRILQLLFHLQAPLLHEELHRFIDEPVLRLFEQLAQLGKRRLGLEIKPMSGCFDAHDYKLHGKQVDVK